MDEVPRALDYVLNKRLRGLGVALYRLTGGRIARLFGAPAEVLLLTTRGCKSGRERTVLLPGFRDGADLIVVAANSGRSSHPDRFYHLVATPIARIQLMNHTLAVRAEELTANERAVFWLRILRIAPTYARYRRATSRTIPLVRLVPAVPRSEPLIPTSEALPTSP